MSDESGESPYRVSTATSTSVPLSETEDPSIRDPRTGYLIAPDPKQTGWPAGIPYIIGNEACERFSYYGMRAILQIHMTALYAALIIGERTAEAVEAARSEAQHSVHLFAAGVYAFPMIGALVADRLLGKYWTILSLSIVYCLGHLVLAFGEESLGGMYLGLGLIAIGSGGIKPCVSAHVGDQFGKGNWGRVEKVFQWFYFSINFGSFFATLLIPWLHARFGAGVAFGVPGILMFLATIAFWMGRKVFVHIPPKHGGKLGLMDSASSILMFAAFIGIPMFASEFLELKWILLLVVAMGLAGLGLFLVRQKVQQDDGFLAVTLHAFGSIVSGRNASARTESATAPENDIRRHWLFADAARKFGPETAEGPLAVFRIVSVFLLVSVFWALFDQHMTSWIRQAEQMNLTVNLLFTKITLLPSQIQSLNPLLVMILLPVINLFVYPAMARLGFNPTPLRKMTVGMAVASLAFVAVATIQHTINAAEPGSVSVLWQIIPYVIMTSAEVMVSVTGLEFAYTQAPKPMKSTIMGFWLLAVSLGNLLVAFLTRFEGLPLVDFFWVFAGLMAVAAGLFAVFSLFYRYREYQQ